eukprot:s728_g1.t1
MVFLSLALNFPIAQPTPGCFNSAVTAPDEVAELHGDEESLMDDLPFKCSWVVWQQRAAPKSTSGTSSSHYEESTKQIASISSVEEFWQTWECLPQPSDLLTRRMAEKNLDGSEDCHYVDALMIFREGVLPQWEDAANSEGGHFQFHFKTSIGAAQLDEYWNNVVLGALGNTLEPDMITGLRLVDKITGPKGGVPSTLRIEVIDDVMTVATLDAEDIAMAQEVAAKHAAEEEEAILGLAAASTSSLPMEFEV